MADTKFTPGRLRIESHPGTGVMLRDERGERVGYVYDTDKANLLAAAPELYAALQKALPILDYIVENGWDEAPPLGWQPNETEALNDVLAALRKARGEA